MESTVEKARFSWIWVLIPLCIVVLSISGCKKEIKVDVPPPEPAKERTENQKLLDTLYQLYHLYSYWSESLPSSDPISSYTDKFDTRNHWFYNAEDLLNDLMNKTPFYSGYGGSYDRFSYIADISNGSSSARADNEDGYGIYTTVVRPNNDEMIGHMYIYFVEGGSPAATKAIKRGDRIIQVNDRDVSEIPLINSNGQITPDQSSGGNYKFVENALRAQTIDIDLLRGEDTVKYSLNYRTYPIDPYLKDTIYKNDSKKIGYLALSSFEQISTGNALYNKLESTFDKFADANANELILDLRYNIGGYVHASDYLANKIINEAGDGELMYTYKTNSKIKDWPRSRQQEFQPVYFQKNNDLNLHNVYFLVTKNTASASEMLINSLLPYFPNAQIISEWDNTYGKPVGFFPEDIYDKVELWAASFLTVNKNNQQVPWDGIEGTKKNIIDNVLLDFGNPNESMIAKALESAGVTLANQQSRMKRASAPRSVSTKVKDINTRKPKNLIKQ